MRRLHPAFFWLAVFSGLATDAATGDGPAKEVPELQALDHYVGEWDIEVTSANAPFTKGEVTAQWVLDGRFVEQVITFQPAEGGMPLKMRTLMTYDQDKMGYRVWTFTSTGDAAEAAAKWNPDTKTMTRVNEINGSTSTLKATFLDGTQKWSIVITNPEGKQVFEMTGLNRRREEKK